MNKAIKYLETVATPTNDGISDPTEDVSLSEAIFATKMAQAELILAISELKDHNAIIALIEDRQRQFKKEIQFLNKY